MHSYMHAYILIQILYSGFFPNVLIFPNFQNELKLGKLYSKLLVALKEKRVDCVIMNISIT